MVPDFVARIHAGIFSRWRSIGYAAHGLGLLVSQEPNARLHLFATLAVVIAGAFAGLSLEEWRWIALACGLVWAAESFNTAIERLCDRICPTRDPLIGAAKDFAAGAVLVTALVAAAIGISVFAPHFPIAAPQQ
ncbi:diacylglycerol kinase family protein [uncultured Sphingomonas sp.]|uniref:diacylglycerol kinase family protein n=1 Tax=uncultured Sphingomonas sp. TaxID=158754 RepID=UPI0026394012|nr:diacylglycerol kinase family protein [uncultured Sphingomonas sp.]